MRRDTGGIGRWLVISEKWSAAISSDSSDGITFSKDKSSMSYTTTCGLTTAICFNQFFFVIFGVAISKFSPIMQSALTKG